jgi:hypothetical protein
MLQPDGHDPGFEADQSANTRLAVWAWTWSYVLDHPAGGGSGLSPEPIQVRTVAAQTSGDVSVVTPRPRPTPAGLSSAYFEMLGEQGFSACSCSSDPRHRPGADGDPAALRRAEGDDCGSPVTARISSSLSGRRLFVGIAYQPSSI